jgi:hypothetical protein
MQCLRVLCVAGCGAQDSLRKQKKNAHCAKAFRAAASPTDLTADRRRNLGDGRGKPPPTLFLLSFTAKLYNILFLI